MNVSHSNKLKIVIFGGNGFVGSKVAENLVELGVPTICVSRTGSKPKHLESQLWSEQVEWIKGDASKPDVDLLKQASSIVCTVGSPPIPTLSQQAYAKQLFMNGTCNINAIEEAANYGVKRCVLVGASIPWPLRNNDFAYYKGKQLAKKSAQRFSEQSDAHSACVVEPGVVVGRRYLKNGASVPLNILLYPALKLAPWYFVDLNKLAKRIALEACELDKPKAFEVL